MLYFRAYSAWKDLERDLFSIKFKLLDNLDTEIKAPNSALHYENLPQLPPPARIQSNSEDGTLQKNCPWLKTNDPSVKSPTSDVWPSSENTN